MDNDARLSRFGPVLLRVGLTLLFLWFGLSQVTKPADWISWIPTWAQSLSFISPTMLVLFNGTFETVLGIALAAGFLTRWVALLLSLHLFLIAYEIGYNDIGVRDFVLALATLAISLNGPDIATLDARRTARANSLSNTAGGVV